MRITRRPDRFPVSYSILSITGIALLVVIAVAVGAIGRIGLGEVVDKKLAGQVNHETTPAHKESIESCCDEDPEQWAAAIEEFQAVSDGTVQIQPEEMPAYWRVLTWVCQQPIDAFRKRPAARPLRKDLLHHSDARRGKLYKIDMQVCRVMPYEISDSRLGVRQLYEVWGWTRESGAWLYVGVTPELPPGFPTGESVSESATFYGYFFKVQGYLEAGAAPRSKPLQAPLLLGKIDWQPDIQSTVSGDRILWMVGIGVTLAWFVYRLARVFIGRRNLLSKTTVPSGRDYPLAADQWLQGIRQAPAPPMSAENERS